MTPLLVLLSLTPELSIQSVAGDCAREAVVLEAEAGLASALRFHDVAAGSGEPGAFAAKSCLVTMTVAGIPGFQARRGGALAKGQAKVEGDGVGVASARYYASGAASAVFHRSFETPYDGAFLGETAHGEQWLACGKDAEVNVLVDVEALGTARVAVETIQIPVILYRRCKGE